MSVDVASALHGHRTLLARARGLPTLRVRSGGARVLDGSVGGAESVKWLSLAGLWPASDQQGDRLCWLAVSSIDAPLATTEIKSSGKLRRCDGAPSVRAPGR
jgi:hypothetical protein